MTTPSFSTMPLKPLFSTPSPKHIYFPTLEWKLECVPTRADNQLLTLSASPWPAVTSPASAQSRVSSGPFPAAAAMRTHGMALQQPGRCAEAQDKGSRTDRHSLGWAGPTGWHGQVIAECPWLLGTSGFHLLPWMSLLPPSQGRAALSLER